MTKENPTEKDVKAKAKKLLTEFGYFWFMPAANAFGINGVSDIIGVKTNPHGKVIMLCVETKLTKKTGSVLQDRFGANVATNGGHYIVVNMPMIENNAFREYLVSLDSVR